MDGGFPMDETLPKTSAPRAVALQYGENDRVPKIIASGVGELARRILELAKRYEIPIHRDQSLAQILSQLDLDYEIPPETYEVVAEILAFLYRTDLEWQKKRVWSKTEVVVQQK